MMTQPPPVWPHNERGYSFTVDDKAITPEELDRRIFDPLRKARVDAAYAKMHKNLNQQLYGDLYPVKHLRPTRRERLQAFRSRIHDAWLVLTGRADIG